MTTDINPIATFYGEIAKYAECFVAYYQEALVHDSYFCGTNLIAKLLWRLFYLLFHHRHKAKIDIAAIS